MLKVDKTPDKDKGSISHNPVRSIAVENTAHFTERFFQPQSIAVARGSSSPLECKSRAPRPRPHVDFPNFFLSDRHLVGGRPAPQFDLSSLMHAGLAWDGTLVVLVWAPPYFPLLLLLLLPVVRGKMTFGSSGMTAAAAALLFSLFRQVERSDKARR